MKSIIRFVREPLIGLIGNGLLISACLTAFAQPLVPTNEVVRCPGLLRETHTFDGIISHCAWAEQGKKPDSIIATFTPAASSTLPAMSRALYTYPTVANYKSAEDPNVASNFSFCIPPKK